MPPASGRSLVPFAEPLLGPVSYMSQPEHYGEPPHEMTPEEKAAYQRYLDQFVIAGQARRHLVEFQLGQDGHPVEGLLAMHGDVVAQGLERLAGERLVHAFGLLQAHDVGRPLAKPCAQVLDSLLNRIDVPCCNAHGGPSRRLIYQHARLHGPPKGFEVNHPRLVF